jgi:hypothetical protein
VKIGVFFWEEVLISDLKRSEAGASAYEFPDTGAITGKMSGIFLNCHLIH